MIPVVYDAVGQATFMKSLDCLRPRGLMVSYGQASGMVPPFQINILSNKGSLFLTRPGLPAHTAEREEFEQPATDLFDAVSTRVVKFEATRQFKWSAAPQAH